MRVPDNIIDDIRNSVDIVDVIGEHVRLKKAGQNFKGLCPFHQEKTPSFTVHQGKQIYKCFGCGEGGNVFTFLMKDQNVTFYDAMKMLADRAGVKLPTFEKEESSSDTHATEALYVINEFAANWFKRVLWESKQGGKALEYLTSRGFKEETLKKFDIGFSPDKWDGLLNAAGKNSFENKLLIESGLAISKGQGKIYDRFRNRIMFPIKNEYGKAVGFGGRVLSDAEKEAKYINSPETPIYHKGKTLYGLFQNKDAIRKKDMIILVEGYTDVMALAEQGVFLGAASLGTSLTLRQAQLIKRYTKNVILLYDADDAGVKAALRGSEVLLEADLEAGVVNLGDSTDPDSFLRENSVEKFYEALKNRSSIVEFYAASFENKGEKLSASVRANRIREMIELVDNIRDNLKRELMLKEIGEKLSTDTKTIFKEYYRKKRTQNRFASKSRRDDDEFQESYIVDIDPLEREFGHVIINSPKQALRLLDAIDIDYIKNTDLKTVADTARELLKTSKKYTPAELISKVDAMSVQQFIANISMESHKIPDDTEEAEQKRLENIADALIARFESKKLERQLAEQQSVLKEAEAKGEDISTHLKKFQDLQKQSKTRQSS